MSIYDIPEDDNDDGLAPKGTDMKDDLVRIGRRFQKSFDASEGDHEAALEAMVEGLKDEDIEINDAIVAAWLFILNHAE